MEYDYSVSGDEGSANSGDAVLSFVFSDTRDISSIAYVPPAIVEEASTTTENVIINDSVSPESTEETVEIIDPGDGTLIE